MSDQARASLPRGSRSAARRSSWSVWVGGLAGFGRGALPALAVSALLSYAVLTPLAPFAREPAANDQRRHLILGGVLVGYALLLLVGRRLPPRTALDLPLLGLVLVAGLAVARSLDPRVSLEVVLSLLPVLPLFYLLADPRLANRRALHAGIVVAALLLSAFALASIGQQWWAWWTFARATGAGGLLPPTMPRVADVGSHPNIVGALLAISLPWLVLTLLRAKGGWRRVAAGAALAVVLAALFFTLARSAWLAGLAGALCPLAGWLLAGRRRPSRRLLVVLTCGAGALALLALVVVFSGARPDWLFRDSLNPRADMRRVGWAIVSDNRLTGVGPGLYVPLYPTHDGAYPFAAVHAHNLIVQVAVDYGLLGLAAGLALALVVGRLLWRLLRWGDANQRAIAWAAAGSLLAFLLFGLADGPQLFPEVWLLLASVLALVTRAGWAAPFPPPLAPVARWFGRTRALVPAAFLLLGLALLPLWWRFDRAAAAHEASIAAVVAGDWDTAVTKASEAARRDPALAAYQIQLGAALAVRYQERSDPADRDAAIAALQRATSGRPANGAALVDLASLQLEADDGEGARATVARLRRVAGRDFLLQLAYGVLLQQTASIDETVETYAGLLVLNPTLAATDFFTSDPFRAARSEQIVDRALERAEEIGGPGPATAGLQAAIAVLAGRAAPSEARLQATLAADPNNVAARVALGRLLLGGGRPAEAEPLLRGAVARQGDAATARAALGDLLAAQGDTTGARRQWAIAGYLGDAAALDALGQSFLPGPVPAEVIRRQRRLLESAAISRFYLPFQTFRFSYYRREPTPIIRPGDWLNALPRDLATWQEHLASWETAEGKR